jgi:hypothetical protein
VGTETNSVIKGVLYNKNGTVDYVFDDVKLDEIITPFENESDAERDQGRTLFLSSSKDYEVSFNAEINEDILYQIGVIHWYDWWNRDRVEYDFEVNI